MDFALKGPILCGIRGDSRRPRRPEAAGSVSRPSNNAAGVWSDTRPDNGTLVSDEVPYPGDSWRRTAQKNPTRETLAAMDLVVFLPLLIILGAFMFFASRRQKKAMQATIDLHSSLAVGDRIHTTSGLLGTITGITDDDIELEIAPGVVTTWMKLAVRDRIDPELESDDDAFEDDDAGTAADVLDSPTSTETVADPDRLKKD